MKRNGATWDATELISRVAGRTASEALIDMDSHDVEELDEAAFTLVVDIAKAHEKVQLKVVWA